MNVHAMLHTVQCKFVFLLFSVIEPKIVCLVMYYQYYVLLCVRFGRQNIAINHPV